MPKVFVAGSLNMDLVVTTKALPRRGETVRGLRFTTYPGGKGGNQAVASARLGASTTLVARVGADRFGTELRDSLSGQGIDTELVRTAAGVSSGTALITVEESGENSIVVVPGANAELEPEDVTDLPVSRGDIVLAQLEIPLESVALLLTQSLARGARTMLNPSPAMAFSRELFEASEIIVVNETELAFYTGHTDVQGRARALAAAKQLTLRATQVAVVTLGSEGVVACCGSNEFAVPGYPVRVVDSTGAGDAFAGALAALLSRGLSLADCLSGANIAAALSVQKPGAQSSPTRAEHDAAWEPIRT